MADRRQLAAVYVGGAVGSLVRAGLSQAVPWSPGHWPWATFAVNILGCGVLGYFTTRLQEQLPVSTYRRPLLGSGFCGGLTTFSTMQLELFRMLGAGQYLLASIYGLSSVLAGFAAVHLATVSVRRVRIRVAL
jgi:CrcB protein